MDERRDGRGRSGRLSRRGAKAYQWAVEGAFSVPIAIGLGYWADSHFGTSPLLLFVGVIVGLGALVRRLMKIRELVGPEEGESGADGGSVDER